MENPFRFPIFNLKKEVKYTDLPKSIDRDALHETPEQSVKRSESMQLGTYLTRMIGATPSLPDIIRLRSEIANLANDTFDVLEAGRGVPFKALYFQENFISNLGNMMDSGPHGSHPRPVVRSTIISDRDYVKGILTNEINITSNDQYDIIGQHLNPMMGYPVRYSRDNQRVKDAILERFEAKQKVNDVSLVTGPDVVAALKQVCKDGKRFDLAFPDLTETTDRINMIQAIQASLKKDGFAFIPITWWKPELIGVPRDQVDWDPDDRGLGLDRKERLAQKEVVRTSVLIDDVVKVDGQEESLEAYLARAFPDVFMVADYRDARTLVIKGTEKPIQLPNFEARVRDNNKLTVSGTSMEWTKK